jgi:hypothetical protein
MDIPKRTEGKIKVHFARPDMFKFYNKNRATKYSDYEVSYTKYSKVLNLFNQEVSRMILEESFEFIMPARLGTLRIRKYKPKIRLDEQGNLIKKNLAPNWEATKELWNKNPKAKEEKKIVYHTNSHSEGYQYRWFYNAYRSNCKNKTAYLFKASRTNKRRLSSLIKDENFKGDYYL